MSYKWIVSDMEFNLENFILVQEKLKAEQQENARLRQVARFAVSTIMQWEDAQKAWEQDKGPDVWDDAVSVLREVGAILVGDKTSPKSR